MKKAVLVLFLALFSLSIGLMAHSGGTDRQGCHNDNQNGGWHCH